MPAEAGRVLLVDDPAWSAVVARLQAANRRAALLLVAPRSDEAEGEAAAAEMAGELGRGDPWEVVDLRGRKPDPGWDLGDELLQ